MKILKGAEVAAKLKERVQEMLAELDGCRPVAAIVRVGEKPDDIAYERNAVKRIAAFGMEARSYVFPENVSREAFEEEFLKISEDPEIDGILLLQPLPKQLDGRRAAEIIRPEKDLDGISPVNAARVFSGEKNGFAPCTAEAVTEILKAYEIPVAGKEAVVVGRSMVIGRPAAMLLLQENATVTICHTKTEALEDVCRRADILVAAAGKAGLVDQKAVAPGAVVIDVGIHVLEDGSLCGDVKWEGLEEKAAAATPVPGGVGSVTTAVLAAHLARAAVMRRTE